MRSTVGELKKRNRKAVNRIKHRTPETPSEITFYCTTLRPLFRRADEISNWLWFVGEAKRTGIKSSLGWW